MISRPELLGIFSQYFPQSTLATGVEAANAVIVRLGNDNDYNSVKVASDVSRSLVADLIVQRFTHQKITCIKEYRGAFPTESLKASKDAVEQAYLRNGYNLSGRLFDDELPSDPYRF